MIVAMTIAVVLIAAAVPGLRSLVLAQRVRNASFDLFAAMTFARSEAIARNLTVSVTPTGGAWTNGWTITASDGTVLRTEGAWANITMSGPSSVTYNTSGRLDAAVSSFSLSGADMSSGDSRCITVDLGGRPRVASGTC
jgi:type IV fimbrial biogenesis protein FimT